MSETGQPARILVIDDNPDIHADFRKVLMPDTSYADEVDRAEAAVFGEAKSAGKPVAFKVDSAYQGAEGLESLLKARTENQPYALAFVDVRMPPGWDGIETTKRLWQADPTLQVVLCTAFADYTADEIAHELGRTDRLLILRKPFDNIEVLQMATALTEKWNLARRLEGHLDNLQLVINEQTKALRASENHYRLLFESSPTPIYVYDSINLAFLAVNEAAVRHYGYSREEFAGMTLRDIALLEEIPAFMDRQSRQVADGNSGIWRHRKKDGKLCEMEITSHPLMFEGKNTWLSLAMDVTERLSLEAQLRQSQKMESVGQLAGGIAHDFNNLLTVINGHAGLLLAKEQLSPRIADPLREISEAAKRAADLTRQLLAFSRKQVLQPQVVDLGEVVKNVNKMLARILGEDIALETDFAPNLPCVKADLGMMEQVMLNLAVNSRDAMPQGGKLRIQTSSEMVDAARAKQNPEASAGRFVCLTMADSGCGIAPENLPRIFEPFFTTKELDRGTGLGLATVYGIIRQHQGWIEVTSEIKHGTTFKIFLPSSNERSGSTAMPAGEPRVIGGTETILVVEDEAPLLKLIRHILEGHGYKVLEASNGKTALEIWGEHRRKIDLLFTDMVLPDGMTGPELADILQISKPALKVIYTSGYDTNKLSQMSSLKEGINFIQKPFHARKLAETVHDCLNRK